MGNTDQWSNMIKDPYDLVENSIGLNLDESENMMDLFNSRSNSNTNTNQDSNLNHSSGSNASSNSSSDNVNTVSNAAGTMEYTAQEYPLPDENFESFDPMMDMNIEDFLTKELKDLDIPVMPSDELSKLDLDMFPNDLDWNVVNDNEIDPNTGYYSSQRPSITPRKLIPGAGLPGQPNAVGHHKKQPSGTAIFGFAKHNKSLSIGSMTVNMKEKKQEMLQQRQQNAGPTEIKMNETIMQQQKELQLALQRQKEMNEKLEEQLRMNKMQQEQLQRALEAQQMTLSQVSSTPVRPPADRSIIVTSNSKNGTYQFPPPAEVSPGGKDVNKHQPISKQTLKANGNGIGNGLLSPFSRASANGSPHRRRQHNYENNGLSAGPDGSNTHGGSKFLAPSMNFSVSSSSTVGHNSDQLLKMSKYFEELTDNADKKNTKSKNQSRSPITPQDQIYENPKTPSLRCNSTFNHNNTSPSNDGSPNHHLRVNLQNKHFARDSTVSTASTIPMGSNDENDSDTQEPSVGLGISLNRAPLKNAPQLQMLPTIPGSSDTTPLKQKHSPQRQMPVKHAFQHTPTKDMIFNKTLTTYLRPGTSENITQRHVTSTEDSQQPESEFVQAQTPSPVLKSQDRFDCLSDSPVHLHYQNHQAPHLSLNASPSASGGRNGKRYGMLPREELDKYILEIGPKQFQCKFPGCGKMFNRRYNARTHIQTHLCDRPYKCDFPGCNKSFVRNHDLQRHKKSHYAKAGGSAASAAAAAAASSTACHDHSHCHHHHDHVREHVIRKPVSPKKAPNVVRDNLTLDHDAARRMQEQLSRGPALANPTT